VRWGTELHDRFMLPHFVQQDFDDVISDLRAAGYALTARGSRRISSSASRCMAAFRRLGIELELRHALEPWHVMGEQGAHGGTVRYVDSSLERLQVKVTGMAGERYVLTCNGRTRAAALDRQGRRIRRRRALPRLEPAVGLHPTIGVHAPLVFDLVDTWMKRSLGGCQYHVEHPGGRNPDRYPVNANEAEGRRLARFTPFGHTPGAIDVAATAGQCRLPVYARLAAFLKPARPGLTPGPVCLMPRSLLSTYPQKPTASTKCSPKTAASARLAAFFAHLEAATPEQMRHRSTTCAGASSKTASPTTSMPIPKAPTGRGNSILCR
jgi:uncharacterized protein (DUF2126 family)